MLKQSVIPKLASELLYEAKQFYQQQQKLSDGILSQLHSIFGDVIITASHLLENCKITRYQISDDGRSVYKVGTTSERYTIFKDINFCQCQTFRTQVLVEGVLITCKHVLALKLNEITDSVKEVTETVTDSQFVEFLNEQLNCVND